MPAICCLHTKNSSDFFHTDQLTTDNLLKKIRVFLFSTKIEQDQTLLDLITVKYHCLKVKNEDAQKSQDVTNDYTLSVKDQPIRNQVCKATPFVLFQVSDLFAYILILSSFATLVFLNCQETNPG